MSRTPHTDVYTVVIYSFGYKYGMPGEVNILVDLRSLPNPYWEESLRPRSGMEEAVAAYVLKSREGEALYPKLREFLVLSIKQHYAVSIVDFRIAIGCTGGRHRSVAMVEALAQALESALDDCAVQHFHRDIEKDPMKAQSCFWHNFC